MARGSDQSAHGRSWRALGRLQDVRPDDPPAVPEPGASRPDEPRIHRRLQRGKAPGRRRHRDAHRADAGPDVHRHILGLRRDPEPVRAAKALQPARGGDR